MIVRNKEIIILPADKQPVGIYVKELQFSKFSLKLEKNDMIYLFTDGYRDQFGGEKGEKFKFPAFKNLLIEISGNKCDKQNEILENTLYNWQNLHKKIYNQIDDILILGIKI